MAKESNKEAAKSGVFNPYETVYSLFDQQFDRVDSIYDEVGRRQAQAVEQANRTISEVTKMTQDSILFTNQISVEWFKAARGTTRWASEIMGSWSR